MEFGFQRVIQQTQLRGLAAHAPNPGHARVCFMERKNVNAQYV
jgi:hypothetical protein